MERRHFFIAGILLNHIYDEIKIFLDARKLPLFIREALPGIGIAKGPAKEFISFGFLRALVIAQAILKKFEDPSLLPAFDYLNKKWGGIENFYLNPSPSFNYDFNIFEKKDSILFEDVKVTGTLSAAWYIARLFCREAIWVEAEQCNWLSYHEIKQNQFGYSLLEVDNGAEGLEGVILFLRGFKKIGIHDTVIEYVLAGAEKFFIQHQGKEIIANEEVGISARSLAIPKQIVVLPEGFSGEELRLELEKVITGDKLPRLSELVLLQNIMTAHIQNERPVGNRLDGTDHFCADMRYGFAGYGYAYLRLYDPLRIISLKGIQF